MFTASASLEKMSNFNFTINFPTNGIPSNIIIAKFSEAQNTILFQDDTNTYRGPDYQIIFNDDNGSFNFNNLDLEFIRSHMNLICDTVKIKRGQYIIIDNKTGEEVEPKSITLKNVLDEEDGEMTPNNNNNNNKDDFELTINFDITNQSLVARRIRDEAGIPLKKGFYEDTEIGVDVRNTVIIVSFYKDKEEFIIETLDKITDILRLTLSEYKLYDEINGEDVILYSYKK